MVPVAEVVFLVVLILLGARWYLRTPMHRARKNSGVHFPNQVAGHMGFGMYSPSNPPPLPQALHGYRKQSREQQEREAEVKREPDGA